MLPKKLKSILKQAADIADIKNFEVNLDEDPLRGDGFLSENYVGYVRNKDTGEIISLYIKKMPSAPGPFGINAYFNENHFYSNIWPELNNFQNKRGIKNPFTHITKFYCGSSELEEQYLCMDNLKFQKFDVIEKSESINEDILKLIFDKYGKFHALTFAFKDQNMDKYTKLVSSLKNLYDQFEEVDDLMDAFVYNFKAAYAALKEVDIENAKKIRPYAENVKELYHNTKTYNGQYSALLHGDCWSNNMLFKKGKTGTIEDVKFIDFQLCHDSTPIHDLSYFFYSGASKEDFEKLDEYLELYHNSFTEFAKELGSDPDKLLPLSSLKSEWKKHSVLGIFMALLVWSVKLTNRDEIKEMTSKGDVIAQGFVDNFRLATESDTFKRNTSDILLHALEYGIL